MALLEFVFQSPWHYFGTLGLLAIIPMSIGATAKAFRPDWMAEYVRKMPEPKDSSDA